MNLKARLNALRKCSAALIAGGLLAASFAAPSARAAEKIVMDGSTTVGPVAKAFAEYYMSMNPGVNITISESGSGNGAKSLMNGACDIANMSRFVKDKEFTAMVDKGIKPVVHVVALDGIAMIVHPANPVGKLTVDQVRRIYQGKISNWRQLGGPNVDITMVSRDTNSGTYETFHKLVMKKERIAEGTEYVGSNGAARSRVQSTRAAIAYVGLGFVDHSVKPLELDGVLPTPRTIATGDYPVARPLYMVTNGYPKMGTHLYKFITLYLTQKGQEIVEGIGFIPVTNY